MVPCVFLICRPGKILNLSQYAVHRPIGGCSTEPVAGAYALFLQVLHNALDEWLLHMLGIWNRKFMMPRLVI